MKRFIILLVLVFTCSISFAQRFTLKDTRDSILYNIEEAVNTIKSNQENYGTYKIYPTENIHILLKLDTSTGVLKMVQWELDRDKEFEIFINSEFLADGILAKKGRFELYPTKNMYQFILLDTMIGTTWHVQWGTKPGEYWIRKISIF